MNSRKAKSHDKFFAVAGALLKDIVTDYVIVTDCAYSRTLPSLVIAAVAVIDVGQQHGQWFDKTFAGGGLLPPFPAASSPSGSNAGGVQDFEDRSIA